MAPIEPRMIPKGVGPSKFGSTEKMSANINVVIRVRPPNERELNSRTVVDIVDDRMLVFDPKEYIEPFFYHGVQQQNRNFLKRTNKQLKFMFDNVFGENSSNEDVFKATTKNTLSALMDGFNCSVFVYGATGAGKTFTMIGSREYPGITYLTMDELFKIIASYEHEREFDICVSYLEVYNENVLDLLKPARGPLQLREDSKFGVIVAGLTISDIKTARELLDMLERGNQNRTQHPTDANSESSRSHAVFQVYVKMRYKTSGEVRIVKLSMIDLAGSERASATGCRGERFKEGANINKSLLALGNCINKLAEGSKFIPYRDSKLTRLLKDSLGGNCQTIMIANVSPACASYEDTYNTLKYAARANKIQMSMKKNIVDCDMHVSQYVKVVEELRKQVKELKGKLALAGGGRVPSAALCVTPAALNKQAHVPDNKSLVKLSEWRVRLVAAYSSHHALQRGYLEAMSRQRILVLRQLVRQRCLAQLARLCDEAEEQASLETCREDVLKQDVAVQNVNRQIASLQSKLQALWSELSTSMANINQLAAQATTECSDVEPYLETMKKEMQLITAQVSDRHKCKLLQIQSDEINALSNSIKEMPHLLRKLYLILMGYNKVTPTLTHEYVSIFRNAKSIRSVSWWDKQDNQEGIDANLERLLSLEVQEPIDISSLMTVEMKPLVNGDVETSEMKPFANGDFETSEMKPFANGDFETSEMKPFANGDFETSEMKPFVNGDVCTTRKRKGTPVKSWSAEAISDATIVIDDSFVEEKNVLNSTQVINVTPAKKRVVGRNALCDIDVNKPIDPSELNSTLMLAGKIDAPVAKKKHVVDLRKGIVERNIFNKIVLPQKSVVKAAVGKPLVGKALPFRRPLTQFNTIGAKPAAVEQGTPVVKQGVQRSVGFKAVRGRERVQRGLPYARAEPAKR